MSASLEDFGAGHSILVDCHGRVVGGNKVAEAARRLKLPLAAVHSSGDTLVVVQRDDLDLTRDRKARRLALADTRGRLPAVSGEVKALPAKIEQALGH